MDIVNCLIAISSIIFVVKSYRSIRHVGIKSYNLFMLVYFLCFLLNTTKLSIYQLEKNFDDIYFLVLGPILFFFSMFLAENAKSKKLKSLQIFSLSKVYLLLLAGYIGVKLYISTVVGWRIESLYMSTYLINGDSLSVPGFTGLAAVSQWTLLILTPYLPRNRKFMGVIYILAMIIFSILHVKRGDIMRMGVFFLVLYLVRNFKGKGFAQKKGTIKKVLLIITILLTVFIIAGNIRQFARGEEKSEIVNSLGFKTNNAALAWMYGYFAINYDVVRMYFNVNNPNKPNALRGIMGGEEDNPYNMNINGFNASTFLSPFIMDYGYYYVFELLVFCLIMMIFLYWSRAIIIDTLYVYILSFYALFPFGNYFLSRAIFVSMIFTIFLSFLIKVPVSSSEKI